MSDEEADVEGRKDEKPNDIASQHDEPQSIAAPDTNGSQSTATNGHLAAKPSASETDEPKLENKPGITFRGDTRFEPTQPNASSTAVMQHPPVSKSKGGRHL